MANIKALEWQSDAQLSAEFSSLHSISRNLYLLLTVLGLALIVTTDNFALKNRA